MTDADELTHWERVAALIEECRAERAACEAIREQFSWRAAPDPTAGETVRERLLAGASEIHAASLLHDPPPEEGLASLGAVDWDWVDAATGLADAFCR